MSEWILERPDGTRIASDHPYDLVQELQRAMFALDPDQRPPSNQELREALIVFIERCAALPNITNSPAVQNAYQAASVYGPLLGYDIRRRSDA